MGDILLVVMILLGVAGTLIKRARDATQGQKNREEAGRPASPEPFQPARTLGGDGKKPAVQGDSFHYPQWLKELMNMDQQAEKEAAQQARLKAAREAEVAQQATADAPAPRQQREHSLSTLTHGLEEAHFEKMHDRLEIHYQPSAAVELEILPDDEEADEGNYRRAFDKQQVMQGFIMSEILTRPHERRRKT